VAGRTAYFFVGRNPDEGERAGSWHRGVTMIQLESRRGDAAQSVTDVAQEKGADSIRGRQAGHWPHYWIVGWQHLTETCEPCAHSGDRHSMTRNRYERFFRLPWGTMSRRRVGAEQIVTKLRKIEVLQGQGKSIAAACKEAGITEQSSGTNGEIFYSPND
jgi:hypothetical protein